MLRHRRQIVLRWPRAAGLLLASIPVIVVAWGWVRSHWRWNVLERCSQEVIFPDESRHRMEADDIFELLMKSPLPLNHPKSLHAQITRIRLESAGGAILASIEDTQHHNGRDFYEVYRHAEWPKVNYLGIGYNGSRWDSSPIPAPCRIIGHPGRLGNWWEQPLPSIGVRYAAESYSSFRKGLTTRRRELVVAYWFLLLLCVMPWALWLALRGARARWTARRRKLGLCQTCGYDLRASKDRCPECGSAIPPPVPPAKEAA